MRFLLFGTAFIGVLALMNRYVYKRFFCVSHFKIKRPGKIFLLSLFLVQIFFVIETIFNFFVNAQLFYYLLSLSVGITLVLFFTTLLYDLLHTSAKFVPFDKGRRKFIKIAFDATMIILALSYLLSGLIGGLKKPAMNHKKIKIKNFPFEDFKIVQLSDLHVGLTFTEAFVKECVERINAQKPDMVVITGDLVDLKIEKIKHKLEPLRDLQSRYGTFYVLGNHEYYHGAASIVKHLRTLGIAPLLNENTLIGQNGKKFNLVGINDLISKRMNTMPYDIDQAFKGVDNSKCTIVLAHQPKTVAIVQHMQYDLMISGHTHGGQIFPFGLLVIIDQPYLAGLYQVDKKKQIFVSRGAGYWGPPVRVLAPSEISVLHISG